jgi:hypothetical protein
MLERNERGVNRRTLQSLDPLKKSKGPCSIDDVAEDNKAMPDWLQQALRVCETYIYFHPQIDMPTLGEQCIPIDREQNSVLIPRIYIHK